MTKPSPFKIEIAPALLEDLQLRLQHARWAETETVTDWRQGVPREYLQSFCDYWSQHDAGLYQLSAL